MEGRRDHWMDNGGMRESKEGCVDDGKRELRCGWGKVGWRSVSIQGHCGQKPSHESVDGWRGYIFLDLLSFSPSFSPPVSLKITTLEDSWAYFSLPLSLLCLFSLSLFPHNHLADRWTGAMMDDALSESDNIFSQSPKQDRTASEVGKDWPLSVFVRSNCCAQSPLSRPPYQLRWVCANQSRPHGPLPSQHLYTWHATTFNHISPLSLSQKAKKK